MAGLRFEPQGDVPERPVLRVEVRIQGAVQTREQRGERDLVLTNKLEVLRFHFGSESGSGICKRFKIQLWIWIQDMNHNTSIPECPQLENLIVMPLAECLYVYTSWNLGTKYDLSP